MALASSGKGVELATFLQPGTPSQAILDREEAISPIAIAMGTRGLTGLRHLLLGSNAERVVEYAPCPVMTIRRPQ